MKMVFADISSAEPTLYIFFERKIIMSMSVQINMEGKQNIRINDKMLKTNLQQILKINVF